jgi:hypothetical protein
MVEGASNSKGLTPMNVFEVKSGIKFNLVELLAALRALQLNRHLLRKKTASNPKQNVEIVEPSELREAYNVHMGLKSIADSYLLTVIKETLVFATSSRCETFPGSYTHAATERLGASDVKSLLNKLGWIPIVVPWTFFKTVVYNKVLAVGKKLEIAPLSEESKLTYVEHRALVHTAISRIDPNSEVPFTEQLAIGPLSGKLREGTIDFSNSKGGRALMDACDLAYNIRNAVRDPKKKATAEHFEKARSRLLNVSANLKFQDAMGTEYPKYAELPVKLKEFCTAHFGFENQSEKRPRSPTPDVVVEGDMAVDTDIIAPLAKQAAVDSGSGEPVRKSLAERQKEFQEQLLKMRSDPRVKRLTKKEQLTPLPTSKRGQNLASRASAQAKTRGARGRPRGRGK